jgi:hypothetical protein
VTGARLAVALALAVAPLCGLARPPAAPARSALAVVAAPDQGGRYELHMAPCSKKTGASSCPVTLQWRQGGATRGSARLPWNAPARLRPVKDEVKRHGVLAAERPARRAWAAGEEEAWVGVSLQAVALDRHRTGLLVQQHAGFEHIQSNHAIYGVVAGRLKRLWRRGPRSGSVQDVMTPADGPPHAIAFSGEGDADLSGLSVQRLRWNEARDALLEGPAQGLLAVSLGIQPDAATTLAALEKDARCLRGYATYALSSLNAHRTVTEQAGTVAVLAVDPRAAKTEVRRLRRCSAALSPSVIAVQPAQQP